jgi:hypothetical protein
MDRLMIVSSDGHIGAPMQAYRPYMEQRYLDEFDAWTKRHAEHAAERAQRKMEKHLIRPPMRPYATSTETSDPATRMAVLDGEGVAAELV